jgi:hypothetical protein
MLVRDPHTQERTGNGFIEFLTTEDATQAKSELDGSATSSGHKLWITYSSSTAKRPTYKDKVQNRDNNKRDWAA